MVSSNDTNVATTAVDESSSPITTGATTITNNSATTERMTHSIKYDVEEGCEPSNNNESSTSSSATISTSTTVTTNAPPSHNSNDSDEPIKATDHDRTQSHVSFQMDGDDNDKNNKNDNNAEQQSKSPVVTSSSSVPTPTSTSYPSSDMKRNSSTSIEGPINASSSSSTAFPNPPTTRTSISSPHPWGALMSHVSTRVMMGATSMSSATNVGGGGGGGGDGLPNTSSKHHPYPTTTGTGSSTTTMTSASTTSGTTSSTIGIVSSISTFCTNQRTTILRVCFIGSLIATAVTCGMIANSVIKSLEQDVGIQTYESVAVSALEGARAIMNRKWLSGIGLATVVSYALPDPNEWPFVAMDGYVPTVSTLAALSNSFTEAIDVIVQEDQIEEFNTYAQSVYKEHGYPETAGVSEGIGFGIYGQERNETTGEMQRYKRVNGSTYYGSRYNFLVPVFQHNVPTATSLMFDVHSEKFRGTAFDSVVDCSMEAATTLSQEQIANHNIHSNSLTPSCGVVTDFIELIVRPGPAALLYQPIFPAQDPTKVVGVVGHSVHWNEVLTNVVPDYVDGLYCIISTSTATYTYVIQTGEPQLVASGDWHDTKYTKYGHSVILNDFATGASASATYTLTVYPSDEMFDAFRTNSPLAVSLGFVAVIVFCSIVFFVYDFFMKHESHQRRVILEMKRRFVRFVSHEIRTPLNTVCMGLDLLQGELQSYVEERETEAAVTAVTERESLLLRNDSSSNSSSIPNGTAEDEDDNGRRRLQETSNKAKSAAAAAAATKLATYKASYEYWLELTRDIMDNSQNSVTLLNDLLNYDKIESGTLRLEVGTVPIWDLVCKVVGQFQIQAANRRMKLNLFLRGIGEGTSDDDGSSYSPLKGSFSKEQQLDIELGKNGLESMECNQTRDEIRQLGVVGDDMRISQVLGNLISNALKFSSEYGVITVTASHIPNGLPSANTLLLPTTADAAGTAASALAASGGGGSTLNLGDSKDAPTSPGPRAGSIRICVKDNGAGLSPDQLRRLFNEGVQFDANRLQGGGGSGLGLFITKGIVHQHGGTIIATSEGPGLGCSFMVELPLFQFPATNQPYTMDYSASKKSGGEEDATELSSGSDNIANSSSRADNVSSSSSNHTPNLEGTVPNKKPPPKHRRVLVVDDALMNRKMLVRLLERAGHTCAVAANGQEAIDAYVADKALAQQQESNDDINGENDDDPEQQHVTFDTILMDSVMPVMGGPDATRLLREMGCTASIIGVTGNVLAEDVAHFKSFGADEVFAKPVRLATLEEYWAIHS